jgi:hypothetical protein
MSDEIRNAEEQSATDDLKIKLLGRDAKISDSGRTMPIQEIRQNVAKNPKNVVIGMADGKRRIGLYRNTYKLDTIEIEAADDLSDSQIREFIKKKILAGDFDYQITTFYNVLRKGINKGDSL